MKICKKCNQSFPNSKIINGVHKSLSRRSYCLNCSPYGENTGYELRKEKTLETQSLPSNQKKHCPICDTDFKRNKNNVCSTCRVEYRRYLNKKELVAFKGNKCVRCGCDDIRCLQFHHKNPNDKNYNISARLQCSIDTLKQEVEKCELICANCHSIEHYQCKQDIIDYYE